MRKLDRIDSSMAMAEAMFVCTPSRRSKARQPRFTTTPVAPTAPNLMNRRDRNGLTKGLMKRLGMGERGGTLHEGPPRVTAGRRDDGRWVFDGKPPQTIGRSPASLQEKSPNLDALVAGAVHSAESRPVLPCRPCQ